MRIFCICFVKKVGDVLFCVEGGYEYYFVNMIHIGGYWFCCANSCKDVC